METVSSLLARELGLEGGTEKKSPANLEDLPDSLRSLVESINKNTSGRDKESKDEKNAAAKRQNQIDMMQRQFNANIQELADVTAMLNDTQSDALKQAEKRAKRDEERHKRDEAARKRAEKLSAVTTRQNAAKNEIGVGLLSALFGKGIGDFAANALKAQAQTRSDIAELSEARYEDKTATAADQKADKLEGAEIEKEDALAGATATYTRKLTEQSTALGEAIQEGAESAATLSRVEEAEGRLAAAKSREKSVAAEGFARLNEAPQSAPAGTQPVPPRVSDGGAPATVLPVSPVTVSPVSPVTVSPTIVTPDGRDALAEAAVERTRKEVAARNSAAAAATAEASDAVGAAKKEVGIAPIAYVGATVRGEMAAAESKAAREEMVAAIRDASLREQERKAEAVDAERLAKNEAYAEKSTGALVSSKEKKSIGATNFVTSAVAPPALVIIGKVMEKFRDMFPVIEQTGNALIEMGTVLPATMFTVGGQIIAGLEYLASELRDAIWTPDVRKRYDKSDAAVMKATGKSRADLFEEAQEGNLEAYKTAATSVTMATSRVGLSEASRGPVRANSRREFTVAETPTTAAGVTHVARTGAEARETFAPPAPAPASQDRALGVIPVGPSSGSVDFWRY